MDKECYINKYLKGVLSNTYYHLNIDISNAKNKLITPTSFLSIRIVVLISTKRKMAGGYLAHRKT